MAVAITIEPKGFKEAAAALAGIKNGFPRAAAAAINRGLLAGRTTAVKGIGSRYNITAAATKGQLTLQKASAGNLSGSLEAKGPMLPVSLFKPTVRLKRTSRRGPRAQYISVAIIKGAKKLIKGAFKAKGRIFERRQPDRTPLFLVSTIGIPFMLGQLGIGTATRERMEQVMAERLAHEVNRRLTAGGAK